MRDSSGRRVLVRARDGRMLAGVCAGVADYFGLDVTLVRVIWAVVSVITGGLGVLAYLVAWIIIWRTGSMWGTLAGGIILGVAQAIGAQLDPGWNLLAGHIAFLVVLALRPEGLFPKVQG